MKTRHIILLHFAYVLIVALFLTACGPESPSLPSASPQNSGDSSKSRNFDEIVKPPKAYYDATMEHALLALSQTPAENAARILYLNFNGASIQNGTALGQSFLPCSKTATIAESGFNLTEQSDIIGGVKKYFKDAGLDMDVTNVMPQSGDFTTILVGGSYKDLGCAGGNGVLGVAPFDVGNLNKSDIGFAFVKAGDPTSLAATTIAHEAAHTYGLDHTVDKTDIMFKSESGEIVGFKSARLESSTAIQNGPELLLKNLSLISVPTASTTTPTQSIPGLPTIPDNLAGLPGLGSLGSLGSLLGGLQPGQALDITSLMSQIGMVLPGGITSIGSIGGLSNLGDIMSVVLTAAQASASTGGGVGGITNISDLLTGFLDPTKLQSQGLLDIAAMAAAIAGGGGGVGGIGSIMGILQGIMGGTGTGGITNAIPTSVMGTLPNFANILDISNVTSLPDLMGTMQGHTALVNSNYTGRNQTALLSMLKVAYAQAYTTQVVLP